MMRKQRFGLTLAMVLLLFSSCVSAGETAHAVGDFAVNVAGNLVDYSDGKLTVKMLSLKDVVLIFNDLAGDTVTIEVNGKTFETPLSALGYNLGLVLGGTDGTGTASAYLVDQALLLSDLGVSKFASLVAAAGLTVATGDQHYVEKVILDIDMSLKQLAVGMFVDWPSRFYEGFVYYAPVDGGKNYDLQRLNDQYRLREIRVSQLKKLKAEVDKLTNLQDDWLRLASNWETSRVIPGDMPIGSATPSYIMDAIFRSTPKGTILSYTGNTVIATYTPDGMRTTRPGGSIDMDLDFNKRDFTGHAILQETKQGNYTWYGYRIGFSGDFSENGLNGNVDLMENLSRPTMEKWVPVSSDFTGSFMGPKAEGIAGRFNAISKDGSEMVGSYGVIQSGFTGPSVY